MFFKNHLYFFIILYNATIIINKKSKGLMTVFVFISVKFNKGGCEFCSKARGNESRTKYTLPKSELLFEVNYKYQLLKLVFVLFSVLKKREPYLYFTMMSKKAVVDGFYTL